ncbi:MAG: hypothetical protein AAGA68_23695 [Pseudomonadota bacterium]
MISDRFAVGFLFGLLWFIVAPSCAARETAVGISPYQEPIQVRQVITTTLQHFVAQEPGDTTTFIDAWSNQTIAIFTIPEGRAYASPKARLTYNGQAVAALMRFADAARPPSGASEPALLGAIRLPQFLSHVQDTNTADAPLEMIVFGSPFYDDRADAAVSMATGLVPSDGHINSSRADTPFGTKNTAPRSQPMRLHWALDPSAQWNSDRHRFFVQRFWTLYVEARGMSLASFNTDRTALLRRASKGANAPAHGYVLEEGEKREMIRLRPADIPQRLYDAEPTTTPPRADMIGAATNVEVGLTWDCARCDLDIYARPHRQAQVLYYGQSITPEGHHWKDHVRAPRGGRENGPANGYETIGFTGTVDLHQLEIAISFYSGTALAGVQAELRLSANGQTWSYPFRLDARRGKKGEGVAEAFASGVTTAPHLAIIDPLAVMGLSPDGS